MKSLSRLAAVLRKEVRQLRRDRLTGGMVLGLPIMQLLLFGYAINMDVRHLPTAIADQANSHLSREFVQRLGETQVTDIVARVRTPQDLEALLRAGTVYVGVYLPPDFDRRVAEGTRGAAQLFVDGSDPTILNIANSLKTMPLRFAPGVERRSERVSPIEVRGFYNPERRTPTNIVPGLIGVILMMTSTLFTAVAVVRERERGNMELLINTPVSATELMIGKIVPYIAIGLLQLAIILFTGQLLFDVPMRGSLIQLYVAAFAFVAANLTLGLLISTVARTQFQAMQMAFFMLLPSILLSGFMFPFDGMPAAARWFGEVLPTTHFIRITRGILLREAGLGDMMGELTALVVFSIVGVVAAASRFNKTLD